MINATPTQLRKAADLVEKILSLQEELNEILGGEVPTTSPSFKAPKKRKMSAAGLANIRAGVAKRMAAQGRAASKPAGKAKKKFSPAARAALAAAAKARWAKVKAAGKTSL